MNNRVFSSALAIIFILFLTNNITAQDFKYIGAKKCGACHKSKKQGEQLKIWKASGHANAYKTLKSEAADKIAKKLGFGDKATEAKECMSCHVTGFGKDAAMFGKSFKMEDGVQCEACHGPGSKYKSMKVMKDHAKSVANGMTDYADEAAIEKQCRTCHNEDSPTYVEFKFKEMWDKISHSIPEKKK